MAWHRVSVVADPQSKTLLGESTDLIASCCSYSTPRVAEVCAETIHGACRRSVLWLVRANRFLCCDPGCFRNLSQKKGTSSHIFLLPGRIASFIQCASEICESSRLDEPGISCSCQLPQSQRQLMGLQHRKQLTSIA